jgi:hypothetical protein
MPLARIIACAVICILAAPAAWSAPASALGPEIAQAEPSGSYVGKLSMTPEHAAIGAQATITGDDFPAGKPVTLIWRTVKGSWKAGDGEYKGRSYAPVGYRIGETTADTSGHISLAFTVPEDFGFEHDIVAQVDHRLLTQAAFNVDMTAKITPENGPPGTPITVDIQGIGWRELENSWMLMYDNGFTGWISAVSTAGTAHFTIPATGSVGAHALRLVHGEFTFPYLNPQQNPVPDRPRFAMTFNLTAGMAVLPTAPEKQLQASVRGLPTTGALKTTPAFGSVGSEVEVKVSGFAAGKTYALNWTTQTGNRVAAGAWEESSKPIAEARASASGDLVFKVKVPDDLGGSHALWVGEGAAKKSGTYWVETSALPLDVVRGPAGTTFAVHLKGVGWTETANIYHVVYDNAYEGYACGFNSQGDVTVFLPISGEPGWHFVDLYPGIYKGQETRPNNFRIPQLTYAADHPGEDLPAFHFAVEVTAPRAISQ